MNTQEQIEKIIEETLPSNTLSQAYKRGMAVKLTELATFLIAEHQKEVADWEKRYNIAISVDAKSESILRKELSDLRAKLELYQQVLTPEHQKEVKELKKDRDHWKESNREGNKAHAQTHAELSDLRAKLARFQHPAYETLQEKISSWKNLSNKNYLVAKRYEGGSASNQRHMGQADAYQICAIELQELLAPQPTVEPIRLAGHNPNNSSCESYEGGVCSCNRPTIESQLEPTRKDGDGKCAASVTPIMKEDINSIGITITGQPNPPVTGELPWRELMARCFTYLGREIERKTLNESAQDGTQLLSRQIAELLDRSAVTPSPQQAAECQHRIVTVTIFKADGSEGNCEICNVPMKFNHQTKLWRVIGELPSDRRAVTPAPQQRSIDDSASVPKEAAQEPVKTLRDELSLSNYSNEKLVTLFQEICARLAMYNTEVLFNRMWEIHHELTGRLDSMLTTRTKGEQK